MTELDAKSVGTGPNPPVTIEPPTTIEPAEFVEGGEYIDHVNVRISYGIIERFSEGLYSSPNKAFEELVSNSYDAGANCVWVLIPDDLEAEDATLCVIDDGLSMDLQGLQELWHIGESPKRSHDGEDEERVIEGRAPIGKFGIGKLATYVLAEKLTYVCRRDKEYLAVTMDFGQVKGKFTELKSMALNVVSLSADEAKKSLEGIVPDPELVETLFGPKAPEHWTAAIMTDLKPNGRDIQRGRLRWILRTALPISPKFGLIFNSEPLVPTKAEGTKDWTFKIGESDSTPNNWKYRNLRVELEGRPAIDLPHAGLIRGEAQLFSNSLQRGKSEDWGRSHGFFVKVRGRLINLTDEAFGISVELRHGTLARFRMEVEADGLDAYIASPRESIRESKALEELQDYLLAVFNRARTKHTELENSPDKDSLSASERIADAPAALSQKPVRRLLQHAVEDEDEGLRELFAVDDLKLEQARQALESDENLLSAVLIQDLSDSKRFVGYDIAQRAIVVNAGHPFVRNYLGAKGVGDALRDIGAAEFLTEAYLLDEGFPDTFVRRLLERRDTLLRALTKVRPRSAPVIAEQLRDAKRKKDDLEDAVGDALELLGYDVQRIGGSGTPDGIAMARIGRRGRGTDAMHYSLTYDAKSITSSKKEAIQAGTARTSILHLHRQKAKANHTLLVAPDFEGGKDDESNLAGTCKNDSITPIRVEDLAKLVEIFPLRMISPVTLRPLFDCYTPEQSAEFISTLNEDLPNPPPIEDILHIIAEYSLRKDAVSIDSINAALIERKNIDLGAAEVETVVRGLAALAPRSVWFDDGTISLNTSVETVREEIRATIDPLPSELTSEFERLLGETA